MHHVQPIHSQSRSKFKARMFSRMNRMWSRRCGFSWARLSGRARPARLNSLSTSVLVGGGVRNLSKLGYTTEFGTFYHQTP